MIEEQESVEVEYVGGMTDDAINAKHIRLRGSLAYKYPPRELCCRVECGFNDYYNKKGELPEHHRCFLGAGHSGPCEFSSECVEMQG